jgi:hypothetical protein
MEHIKALRSSRNRKLVDDHKFERHFKRAVRQDIDSRKRIFDSQTENNIEKRERYEKITP